MVIDFGENIMSILMVLGSIASVIFILAMAMILYSVTQVIRQRRQMKEWSRNHTNVGNKEAH
jgi:hypothetical protein